MSVELKFLSGSPFVWRVWLALEHKGIAYEATRLSIKDMKSDAYLALNPRGRVPVLLHEGRALYESTAMLDYLEEVFEGPSLWPADPFERFRARRIVLEASSELFPQTRRFSRQTIFDLDKTPDEAVVAEAKEAIARELGRLETLEGPVTAADFATYPILAFLKRIDERRPGYDAMALVPERFQARMAAVEALPYFDRTYPPHWR